MCFFGWLVLVFSSFFLYEHMCLLVVGYGIVFLFCFFLVFFFGIVGLVLEFLRGGGGE